MRGVLRYLWALPATTVGLVFVLLAWLSGGRAKIVAGVIEVQGGLVAIFMRGGCPGFCPASARTLGHVILGQDQKNLDGSRIHERTHVRQYETWGVLLLPAYLVSSWSAWRRGLDPYYDNRFEREAFDAERSAGS
jgi:Fe-S cluster biogenesis protein NfuA